jgi:hypothetical protein
MAIPAAPPAHTTADKESSPVTLLYKEGGVRSVFRGSAMTLARDGPGSAAYFAAYECSPVTLPSASLGVKERLMYS